MQGYNVDRLPTLVANGELTKAEAANIIWEDMYMYPNKYGLTLADDEKSEFLMYLRERIEVIFSDFEIGKSHFRTYIWGLVRNTLQTWARKVKKKTIEEETVRLMLKSKLEAEQDRYNEEQYRPEGDIAILKKQFRLKRQRKLAERVALVLALKTCHEISEDVVDNVSKFTHIEKDTLQEKIDQLKSQSDYKSVQRERIIRRRDNAFYYHRKYLLELHKLEKGTATFESVEKKYQQQTKSWMRQNKLLSHRFIMAPSNVEIAEALGIEPRRVSFFISHVKKRPNPFTKEDPLAQKAQTEQEPRISTDEQEDG